jgi:hypothetical protein
VSLVVRAWDERSLADLPSPFGAIIDCRDKEWIDRDVLATRIGALLRIGCSCFICVGTGAEVVHDKIDDIILDLDPASPVTTLFSEQFSNDSINDMIHGISIGEPKHFVRFSG